MSDGSVGSVRYQSDQPDQSDVRRIPYGTGVNDPVAGAKTLLAGWPKAFPTAFNGLGFGLTPLGPTVIHGDAGATVDDVGAKPSIFSPSGCRPDGTTGGVVGKMACER